MRAKRREAFWNVLNCQCVNCGESRSLLIDFHHVGSKTNKISLLLSRAVINPTRSRCTALENELLSVVPLCVVCHRFYHAGIIKVSKDIATIDVRGKLYDVFNADAHRRT